MKTKSGIVTAIFLAALGTHAQAVEDCEVEDWVPTGEPGLGFMMISGVASCEAARIRLRVYSGDGDYIGNARTFVRGHSFDAVLQHEYREDLDVEFNFLPMP